MSVTYLAINGEIVQSPSSGGGSGSSGHIIVNNSGTELTNRTNLKTTGGLNATDDSTNDTTEITDVYEEIPWTTWQGYTSAQKAQHPNAIVTGAPDCDGDVEIKFLNLAWTNPSPTASTFEAQAIHLNTDGDYDFARFVFSLTKSGVFKTVDVPKNKTGILDFAWKDTGTPNQAGNISRVVTISNGDTATFENASLTEYNSLTTQNSLCIPMYVYTGKYALTAKIQAIAHDVSTSASKCMMSDGVTPISSAIIFNLDYDNVQSLGRLGTTSADFTPTANGLLKVQSSVTTGFIYISDKLTATTLERTVGDSNTGCFLSFPVQKGRTYSIYTTTNGNIVGTFIPCK